MEKEYQMRQNKEPTVMFMKKYEEPKQYLHCAQCPGERMIRLSDGLRCPTCGGVKVAVRTIILKNPQVSSKE
jgi:Zn finger protein HypA/HybF involved in hydrogenase expression